MEIVLTFNIPAIHAAYFEICCACYRDELIVSPPAKKQKDQIKWKYISVFLSFSVECRLKSSVEILENPLIKYIRVRYIVYKATIKATERERDSFKKKKKELGFVHSSYVCCMTGKNLLVFFLASSCNKRI